MRPFFRLLSTALAVLLVLGPASTAVAAAWTHQTTGLSFSSSTHGLMVGGFQGSGGSSNGFVSQTTDGGLTWSAASVPGKWMIGTGAFSTTGGWAVASWDVDKKPFSITSGPVATPSSGAIAGENVVLRDVAVLENERVAAVGERPKSGNGQVGFIATSLNNGGSWSTGYEGPIYPMGADGITPQTSAQMTALDAAPGGVVAWAIGNEWSDVAKTSYKRPLVLKSTNGGQTWPTTIQTTPSTAGNVIVDVAAVNSNVAFITGFGRTLFRTTNGGTTWTGSSGHIPRDFSNAVGQTHGFAVDALDAERVLVAGQSGKIAWSSKASSSLAADWKFFTIPGLPDLHGAQMLSATDWIVVGHNETVYRTTNGGETWVGTTGLKAPNVAVTAPTSDALLSDTSVLITGTANDGQGTGVTEVELAISRSDGKFWNGTGWSDSQHWLDVQTSSSWKTWRYNWDVGPGQSGQYTFTITARAIDAMNQIGQDSALGVKVVNTVPGTLSGVVTDGGGTQLSGVSVRVGTLSPVSTAVNGSYSLSVPEGTHEVVFSKPGFQDATHFVSVNSGLPTTQNASLMPTVVVTSGTLTGKTTSTANDPLAGVAVKVGAQTVDSDANGNYTLADIPAGTYSVEFSKSGYATQTQTGVTIVSGEVKSLANVALSATTGVLTGTVMAGGQLVSGAKVKVGTLPEVLTNASGIYRVEGIAPGTHGVTYSYGALGTYQPQTLQVAVVADQTATKNVTLEPPKPPITTVTSEIPSTWVSHDVIVALEAVVGEPANEVEGTYYRLNSGADTRYTEPVTVSAAGVNTFYYWSVDTARNIEATKSIEIKIDKTDSVINVAGSNRFDTAIKASERAYPTGLSTSGKRTVVIATGMNWPDALGGTSLAGALDGPVLLVDANSMPAGVAKEITRLKATDAIILGGAAAVGPGVEAALKKQLGNTKVKRIAGSNRYKTADEVAKAVIAAQPGTYSGKAFVATGGNFPDALAAAPIAAAGKWPLYLADPKTGLSAGTKTAMNGVKEAVVLGGTGVVPESVQAHLSQRFGSAKVKRIAGSNRYDTAARVAAHGVTVEKLKWDFVGITTGENFPDALAGGVVQGKAGSVMLLTPPTKLDPYAAAELRKSKTSIGTVTYFGGANAVTSGVRTSVASSLK